MRSHARAVCDDEGQVLYYEGSFEDITEHLDAMDALFWEMETNVTFADLANALLSLSSTDRIPLLILEHARRLTGSEAGFVGYVEPETGQLVCSSIDGDAWGFVQADDGDNAFFIEHEGDEAGGELPAGISWPWQEGPPGGGSTAMLSTGVEPMPVMSDGRSARSYLSVPAIIGGKLVGQLALANPEREYTDRDLKIVKRLTDIYAIALHRARAEDELHKHRSQLEDLVRERTADLLGTNERLEKEIAERRRAEEQIKASLREKEVLLREIHHRVKNNLQLVSSLLDMTSMRTRNAEAISLLNDTRAKIYSIALIHMQLYESDRFDRIGMEEHLGQLVRYLTQVYSSSAGRIRLEVAPSDVFLTVNQAIPCALVLNELMSNAFKHAFKDGAPGVIRVTITMNDDNSGVHMSVRDNGVGIPEDVDFDSTDTLGLQLVKTLVELQLKGSVKLLRDTGTELLIEFKLAESRDVYRRKQETERLTRTAPIIGEPSYERGSLV